MLPVVEALPVAAKIETVTVRAQAREQRKVDPKMIAAARELRDRYLERVNVDASAVLAGKYDVSRSIAGPVEAKRLAA